MSTDHDAAPPTASRPHVPGYGIPETNEGTLPWNHVVERLTAARNYWVATAGQDKRPHAVPVWGVWLAGSLILSGGAKTRWVRDLTANPHISVHLESGDDVVILEGAVEVITDPAHPLVAQSAAAYQAKYNVGIEAPVWVLRPKLALAWTSFPADTTRWIIGEQ